MGPLLVPGVQCEVQRLGAGWVGFVRELQVHSGGAQGPSGLLQQCLEGPCVQGIEPALAASKAGTLSLVSSLPSQKDNSVISTVQDWMCRLRTISV